MGWDDSDNAFIVKNSWNNSWGEDGYFRIAYNEFDGVTQFGKRIWAYSYEGEPDVACGNVFDDTQGYWTAGKCVKRLTDGWDYCINFNDKEPESSTFLGSWGLDVNNNTFVVKLTLGDISDDLTKGEEILAHAKIYQLSSPWATYGEKRQILLKSGVNEIQIQCNGTDPYALFTLSLNIPFNDSKTFSLTDFELTKLPQANCVCGSVFDDTQDYWTARKCIKRLTNGWEYCINFNDKEPEYLYTLESWGLNVNNDTFFLKLTVGDISDDLTKGEEILVNVKIYKQSSPFTTYGYQRQTLKSGVNEIQIQCNGTDPYALFALSLNIPFNNCKTFSLTDFGLTKK